jgi:Papain family cysteine protease
MADDRKYWMDDDDFGDFGDDDGGDFDDNGNNGDDDDDPDDDQDDNPDDADEPDEEDEPDNAAAGNNGGDGGDGNNDDENVDDLFASTEDLPQIDDDAFATAADFPNADESDFEGDTGDWTADDYEESAKNLFGDHEFFGDTLVQQKIDEGFTPYDDDRFKKAFEEVAPGTADTVHLLERDGKLFAFGVVSQAVLQMLLARYQGMDLTNLEVGVPPKGEPVPTQPLPPAFADVKEQDAVDLRKYCSPIGDQGQTGRCSAFAWTHATEMGRNVLNNESTRLCPNFTMLEFQRMQGDAQDYRHAYEGGDGTISGPEPGQVLVQNGTCRQELWPDDTPSPLTREDQLIADAQRYHLDAVPLPIAIDDVKKVLSAGCPVHVSMNTGSAFSDVGRDGVFDAAEAPWGRHGRHAMLIVGYTGNFFTLKNSWGSDWGDQGYCFVPKNVLAASDPEFVAVLLKRESTTAKS